MKVYPRFHWTTNPQFWEVSACHLGSKAVLFRLAKLFLEALRFVLYQHANSWNNSPWRHVGPLGHIIQIPSKPGPGAGAIKLENLLRSENILKFDWLRTQIWAKKFTQQRKRFMASGRVFLFLLNAGPGDSMS